MSSLSSMEQRNVIAKAAAASGLASPLEENGCDCPHRTAEGSPNQFVDHYCGYKREYSHR